MAEFLPLCDLLFNIVSLAAYFCDLVFDLLVVYTLYDRGPRHLFYQCLAVVLAATILSHTLSLRWYLQKKPSGFTRSCVVTLHVLQMGVLWRYARLLAPVRLSDVKCEVRDLCVLRLLHGLAHAAPMLLLQAQLLRDDLSRVSAALSLFSVCWGLASFSKHVRSVDKLVLTWLGVVSQLLWRAGTVTARAIALSVYASVYGAWVLLVLGLHWACMFFWLLSPKSAYYQQGGTKLPLCALMAAVYVLAYVNLQDRPHRRTMAIFYIVMLLENALLVAAWLTAVWPIRPTHFQLVPILTLSLFLAGILFMLIYYRYFHIRRLLTAAKPSPHPPGVFNCRFGGHPSASSAANNIYRKKKKPTSFVPPPAAPMAVPFWRRPAPSSTSENEGSSVGSRVNIHQKLQEKKQKQLAELKIIEEEIKQGKLVGPEGVDLDTRQPIPKVKRHVEPQLLSLASLNNLASYGVNLNRRPPPRAPRSRTPELLLTPRYLYCDCAAAPVAEPEPTEQTAVAVAVAAAAVASDDLESQVSLPRSYTLPREFKYYRRGRTRRPVQTTVASTNSSDGDVDSPDDESERNSPAPAVLRHIRRPFRHETKL